MGWRLVIIDGADTGRTFPLPEGGPATIGSRRKDATILLHDLCVAPLHCQVEVAAGGVRVTESEKARQQGTFVNGQRVARHDLHAGDVLRVGNSHLRLEAEESTTEPAPEPPAREPAPLPHLPGERLEELAGHHLGHFQLRGVLGKGHSGVVFRARDVKSDRVVALKVLSPDFPADDSEMQRFVRGIKAVLPLRHPNLVTVYGAGKSGPYCWIAREYIDGEGLTPVLQRLHEAPRIDWRRACRVAVHVARALEYAREHHVGHNNVTPQNIIIQTADQVAKLGDLMLLKALEGSRLQQATLEAKLLAELSYLSPEQVDPDAFVDDLTDLYSLGTIAYALATGHPVFTGQGPEEIIAAVQGGEVVKPSHHQRGIPPAFEKVVLRMLAKRQEDRYQHPGELRGDLEAVAEEHEVEV